MCHIDFFDYRGHFLKDELCPSTVQPNWFAQPIFFVHLEDRCLLA